MPPIYSEREEGRATLSHVPHAVGLMHKNRRFTLRESGVRLE